MFTNVHKINRVVIKKLPYFILAITLIIEFYFILPLPVSLRVLNELSAWRPQVACLVACVALSLVVTEGVWAAAVMILEHPFLGYCYNREEQVVKYVGEMLLLIALSQLFDGIQSILSCFFLLT